MLKLIVEDEYKRYLKRVHGNKLASEELISEVVRKATGYPFVSKNKIIAGEVNEVYDIQLKNRNNVVVRFYKSKWPTFDQEKWAIDRCREKGIPAPAVLLIKHIKEDGGVLSVCVQEKLEGDSLERGKVPYNRLDRELLRRVLSKSGDLLTRIHSIQVEGFDRLDGEGKGEYETFEGMMAGKPHQFEIYQKIARVSDISEKDVLKALEVQVNEARKIGIFKPVLNHGDFSPKHIIFKDGEITGIVDFGDVLGHSPVFDFARWEYWYGDDERLDWLKDGYLDKSVFGEGFQEMSNLIQLHISLTTIHWYSHRNYNEGIKQSANKMKRLLEFYK